MPQFGAVFNSVLGALLLLIGLWLFVIWLKPDALGGALVEWAQRLRIWRSRGPRTEQGTMLLAANAVVLTGLGIWTLLTNR